MYNNMIDSLLEAADNLVDESVEETTINGYTLDEAAAILEAADEIMDSMNEADALARRRKREFKEGMKNASNKEEFANNFAKRYYASNTMMDKDIRDKKDAEERLGHPIKKFTPTFRDPAFERNEAKRRAQINAEDEYDKQRERIERIRSKKENNNS